MILVVGVGIHVVIVLVFVLTEFPTAAVHDPLINFAPNFMIYVRKLKQL